MRRHAHAAEVDVVEVAQRDAVSRQLEQAQRRFEVGLIAITDVQQSRAGYDDAVAAEIETQRLLSTAYEQLREIIGEIVQDLASPTDELPLLTPDPASEDEWVRAALDSNLALQSSRLAAEVANDQIKIEKGNRLPTLNLTANYNDDEQTRVQTLFRQLVETTPSTQLPLVHSPLRVQGKPSRWVHAGFEAQVASPVHVHVPSAPARLQDSQTIGTAGLTLKLAHGQLKTQLASVAGMKISIGM